MMKPTTATFHAPDIVNRNYFSAYLVHSIVPRYLCTGSQRIPRLVGILQTELVPRKDAVPPGCTARQRAVSEGTE